MNTISSLTFAFALAVAPALAVAQGQSTEPAKVAALAWLQKLDSADYAATWHSAASMFKGAVTMQSWQQSAQAARAPFGAMRSRVERSATFTRSLPGAPEGQYVVLQFLTAYEHKQQAAETITAAQEPDGTWKIAGYFIK